jgi:hypothetical protein
MSLEFVADRDERWRATFASDVNDPIEPFAYPLADDVIEHGELRVVVEGGAARGGSLHGRVEQSARIIPRPHPRATERHPRPKADRDLLATAHGSRRRTGRAPRQATNARTRGGRRGASTRTSSRGGDSGDPDEGDPEPPGPYLAPRPRRRQGARP